MASTDELWLVDFGDPFPGEPASVRPALVVGRPGTFGASFPFVLVSPLTTVQRGLSLHVDSPELSPRVQTLASTPADLVRGLAPVLSQPLVDLDRSHRSPQV